MCQGVRRRLGRPLDRVVDALRVFDGFSCHDITLRLKTVPFDRGSYDEPLVVHKDYRRGNRRQIGAIDFYRRSENGVVFSRCS